MKKFIYIMVAFMLMLILSGCATTAEQRKELYNQRDTAWTQMVSCTVPLLHINTNAETILTGACPASPAL
jgi:hypothetical protein